MEYFTDSISEWRGGRHRKQHDTGILRYTKQLTCVPLEKTGDRVGSKPASIHHFVQRGASARRSPSLLYRSLFKNGNVQDTVLLYAYCKVQLEPAVALRSSQHAAWRSPRLIAPSHPTKRQLALFGQPQQNDTVMHYVVKHNLLSCSKIASVPYRRSWILLEWMARLLDAAHRQTSG